MLWYHMCVKYGAAERERERERRERLSKCWQMNNREFWIKGIHDFLYFSCNFFTQLKLFQNNICGFWMQSLCNLPISRNLFHIIFKICNLPLKHLPPCPIFLYSTSCCLIYNVLIYHYLLSFTRICLWG